MKINRKKDITKRLLSIFLCLCCAVLPLLPMFHVHVSAASEPTVSLSWASGTSMVNGAAVKGSGNKLTAVLTLSGNAEGTVKVKVSTFNISATSSDYTMVSNTYELSNTLRSVNISVVPYGSSNVTKEEITVKVGDTVYKKQFGLRIDSVENAEKDPVQNTLRAQAYTNSANTVPVYQNSSQSYYSRNTNESAYMLSGYTFSGAASEWTYNLYMNGIEGEETATNSFNLYNSLGSSYAKALYNNKNDTHIYFRGSGAIDDNYYKYIGGFTLKLYDRNNSGNVFFTGNRGKGIDFEGETFSWLNYNYDNEYSKDNCIPANPRASAPGYSGGSETPYAIKGTVSDIELSVYNNSDYAYKYLKNFKYTVFLADNDGPQVISYSVGAGTYGKNDTVYISVKFNEPVQVESGGTVGGKTLGLKTVIDDKTVNFEYVDGAFTDTLIFGAKLDREYVSDSIKVIEFTNCYSIGNGGVRIMDMMWNTANQNNLFVASKGTVSNPLATITTVIDTRDPEIRFGSCDTADKTSREHTVNVYISNISSSGKVYYAWSKDPNPKLINSWISKVFNTSGTTAIKGTDFTGDYYLHVKAVGINGQVTLWTSEQTFSFDNEYPRIEEIYCEFPASATDWHDLVVKVKAEDMAKLACVYMYVISADGKYIVSDQEVYNRASVSNGKLRFTGNEGAITLTATDLGLNDGDYLWVSAGFEALDIYGNRSPIPVYSVQLLYDNRKDFKAEIEQEPIRDLNGYSVYKNDDQTYSIKFNSQSDSSEAINVYGIFSIKRNGEYIYNAADPKNNGGQSFTLEDLKDYDLNQVDYKDLLEKLFATEGWLGGRSAATEGFRFEFADDGGTVLNMTVSEEARGFYEFEYFANGKRAEEKLFLTSGADDTENYLDMAVSGLMANEVWKFTTNKFYSFEITEDGTGSPVYNVNGTAYCDRNAYPIFSSREKAYEYALFTELQDLELIYLDSSMSSVVDMLNGSGSSGHFVKASGETATAAVGQTWIRYKSASWNPQYTTSAQHWVYYYYSNVKETKIDVNLIFPLDIDTVLGLALENNAKDICGYDTDYTYLTKNNSAVDSNGEPTYNEAAVFPNDISYTGDFKTPISFEGDGYIYNNKISYNWGKGTLDDVILVKNHTFTAKNSPTTIYYRVYNGEDNTTRYQSFRLEKDGERKLADEIKTSGLYEIIETGEGYRKFCIYVDNDVPVLEYEYVRNGTTFTGYIDNVLNGTTVRGSSMTLKRILTTAQGTYPVEYDSQAYVYITNNAGTKVLLFATLGQLAASKGIAVPVGNYKLHVYDRLGNHTEVNLRTNSSSLELLGEINDSGDTLTVDINRAKDEIESFSVTKNGMEYEIEYASQMRFRQSGLYEISVSDIYGESVTYSIELDRGLPSVEFYYRNENGLFVPFGGASSGSAYIDLIEEGVYQIVTSADVQMRYSGEYTVTAVAGEPTIDRAILGGSVTVKDPDNSGWTVKVALTSDPTTYILVSCGYDKEAPTITATATIPTYSFNEIEMKGNVLFAKLSESKQLGITNGSKFSGESVTIEWSDQNMIRQVYYLKDGERYNVTEDTFNDQSLTLSGEGSYEVVVTDIINNTASFTFTISRKIALEYLIDGVNTKYHSAPLDAMIDGKFTYTQNTGKEVAFVLGEPLMIAFMYSDGVDSHICNMYWDTNEITVFIYDYEQGVLVDTFKSQGSEGNLFGGAKYPFEFGYSIAEGVATLTLPPCDNEYELWQFRITDDNTSYPYIIQFERSNKVPTVEFVKEGENIPLENNGNAYIGVNTPVVILPESVDSTVSSIIAYYSENFTADFKNTESFVLYDGSTLEKISEAGYYKIVVQNIYGNQQTVYIRIGYDFDMSVELVYDSGDKNGYLLNNGEYALYTNKSARIYIWASLSECTVTATRNGSIYVPRFNEQDAGFYIDVTGVGEYVFNIKDSCGHEIELALSVKEPVNLIYGDYLEGFNQNALYKDRSYTNAPLDVVFDKISANGIGKISYKYSKNGVAEHESVIYDIVSENRVEFSSNKFKGAIGKDGNGEYTVIFMDMYGNTVSKTVYISSAEQLIINRLTLNDAKEQPYSLADAIAKGAWSNRSIILKDVSAASVLKINGEVVSFTDGVYRFDFPANLGQGHEIYTVEYVDEYGNHYSFAVNLYRKTPEVTLTDGASHTEINGSVYIRNEFGYVWSDVNLSAVYSKGNETFAYMNGQKLSGEGTYLFTFTDLAGNIAVRTLIYDTVVSYKLINGLDEVRSGIATNGTISIKVNGEQISIISAKRDGEEYPTDSMNFKEHGYYEVTLGDPVGNTTVVRFYIITHAFNDFAYVAEDGFAITEVWFTVDGFRLSYVGDVIVDEQGRQTYRLGEEGTYELAITDLVLEKTSRFTVSIDKIAPTATLVGVENGGVTREGVTLNDLQIGDLVEVYKNGELIFSQRVTSEVVDPPMIESWGDFRIVVTDEAGNSIEYTFEKQFATNLATNVIILMMMLLAVAGAMMYLYLGKKVRVK